MTRRRNFPHEHKAVKPEGGTEAVHVEPADVRTLLVKEFLVDRLLFVFTEAALLIPSIIHEVCTHLVAAITVSSWVWFHIAHIST